MATNLQAVLEIAAKVTGQGAIDKLSGSIRNLETTGKQAKATLKEVVSSSTFQAAAVGAAAVGTAIGISTNKAFELGSAMVGVQKVVDEFAGAEGFAELQRQLIDLSNQMPITAAGFAEIYEAAGQAGIPAAEIREFAEDAAMMGVAFDISAGQAGDAMATFRTAMGLTQPEVRALGDAINALSNNMATTAPNIVDFVRRVGTVGQMAGLSAEETAAFGAALTAAGATSDVAATSFRNMITALSLGPSMTDRQIDALRTLGYEIDNASEIEKSLTDVVKIESQRRIDARVRETDESIRELEREFRERRTILNDGFADEDRAFNRAQEDKMTAKRRAMQREEELEIERIRKNKGLSDREKQNAIRAVREKYQDRMTAMRRGMEDERIEWQRNERDKRQDQMDALDDEKRIIADGYKQALEEFKKAEEIRKAEAIKSAKETAQAQVDAQVTELSKRLQEDAVGTIKDVFQRIKDLPKEMQMSVIADLFGKEARALLPLINNTEILEKALSTVGDTAKTKGSMMEEYGNKMKSMGMKVQLARNKLDNLLTVFGGAFTQIMAGVANVIGPVLEKFTELLITVPGLKEVVAVLALAFVGLVAALPLVATLLSIKASLALIATTAGASGAAGSVGLLAGAFTAFKMKALGAMAAVIIKWKVMTAGLTFGGIKVAVTGALASVGKLLAVGGILAKVGAFFKGLLAVVTGVFSGPVGWAVLIGAAIALLITFREPIAQFFSWVAEALGNWVASLWEWGEPIRAFWVDIWEQVKVPVTGFFTWMGESLYNLFIQPWVNAFTLLQQGFDQLWPAIQLGFNTFIQGFIETLYTLFLQPWVTLFETMGQAVTMLWESIQLGFSGFLEYWLQALQEIFVSGWENAVTAIQEIGSTLFEGIIDIINGFFEFWIEGLSGGFVEVWTNAMTAISDFARDTWEGIKEFIENFFSWFAGGIFESFAQPFIDATDWIVQGAINAWDSITELVGSFFTAFGTWLSEAFLKPTQDTLNRIAEEFQKVWTGIMEWFGSLGAWFADTAYKIFIEPFVVLGPKLVSLVQETFGQIQDAITEAFGAALDAVSEWAAGVGSYFAQAWQSFYDQLIQPIVDGWNDMLQTVTTAVDTYFIQPVSSMWGAVWESFDQNILQPVSQGWQTLMDGIYDVASSVTEAITGLWQSMSEGIQNAFDAVVTYFNDNIVEPFKSAWQALADSISKAMQGAADAVKGAYQSLLGSVEGAFKGIISAAVRIINSIIGAINKLISGANKVRAALGLSSIGYIGYVSVPGYKDGGVVEKPTLAIIGEGGEREYVVPESKAQTFATNYLAGRRGEEAMAAASAAASRAEQKIVVENRISGGGGTSINLSTGPIQTIDNEQYVKLEDMRAALTRASDQVERSIMNRLRQPSVRQTLGIS